MLISGTRRGLTPKLIADLRRRSAIKAEIGHMKTGWPPVTLPLERRHRRRPLRHALRLRTQHPKDLGPPQGSFGPADRRGPRTHPTREKPSARLRSRLTELFRVNYVAETIPMGRFSTPEEIGEAVLYLASGRSAFMTGHTLVIDGAECL